MALLIRDAMTRSVHTVGASSSLADAAKLMKKHKIRQLPVLEGDTLVGLLNESDLELISAVSELDSSCILVKAAMAEAPWTVAPATQLSEVVTHMAQEKLGSAVVMEEGKVVGVFTTTDGMRVLGELLAR
jgi:acetoin utilization protein AcuB